ncbi:hypothetical protein T484DRAFT_1923001 [Baffinella frigidus]|nr:hypothetical protein T484DRAFT_1923001 [Cryptophyta sp. CCMP2293]
MHGSRQGIAGQTGARVEEPAAARRAVWYRRKLVKRVAGTEPPRWKVKFAAGAPRWKVQFDDGTTRDDIRLDDPAAQ